MTDKLTDLEIADRQKGALKLLSVGSLYKHTKSGGYYVCRGACLRESDLSSLVAYAPLRDPFVVWVRPLDEWLEKFALVKIVC